ncbi:MAG: sigma-70 family RNA polymerase sigma factor [Oscillospiraceae bacterium]|nr:sigma-70 family RNA polymerase sigma factor [Oscillospiraceae bacterium]
MFDFIQLRAVRRRKENALEQIMDRYAAYLCVVIRNTVGESLSREDIEETASDVFFALWENADRVEKLKPWLAATARNKAKNKLRDVRADVPLESAHMGAESYEMDEALSAREKQFAVKSAILNMDSPDREIFLRYYYDAQTAAAIGAGIGMTEAAVKQRLVRGRKKLGEILGKEAYTQ